MMKLWVQLLSLQIELSNSPQEHVLNTHFLWQIALKRLLIEPAKN